MKLREWIKDNKTNPMRFAKSINMDPAALYKYFKGIRGLNKQTIIKIVSATNGEVMFKDLLGMEPHKTETKETE